MEKRLSVKVMLFAYISAWKERRPNYWGGMLMNKFWWQLFMEFTRTSKHFGLLWYGKYENKEAFNKAGDETPKNWEVDLKKLNGLLGKKDTSQEASPGLTSSLLQTSTSSMKNYWSLSPNWLITRREFGLFLSSRPTLPQIASKRDPATTTLPIGNHIPLYWLTILS